jgi:ABC-type multidrug transport system fused ATPase/permease subunit
VANVVLDTAYVSSPCRLRSLDNSTICSGRIIEIDNENIVVRMIPELRSVIPYNQSLKLSILNNKLGNRTLIATVFASTTKIVKLFDIKQVEDFEKRGYYRINVSLQGKVMPYSNYSEPSFEKISANELLNLSDDSEAEAKDRDVAESRSRINVNIKNISLSGVFFSGPMNMEVGEKLIIEIYTPMGKITLGAVIRRKTEPEAGDIEYGCEFEPYPDKVEDALWKYMMQKELENIRNARGGYTP